MGFKGSRLIFQTNKANREKTYADLTINYIKEYGAYNLWKLHCERHGKFVSIKWN